MEKNSKNTADFNFNLIADFFKRLERQGPGSDEISRLALSFAGQLPADAKIADMGCGTGAPTLFLAQNTNAKIVGVDFLPGMIEGLNERIKKHQLQNRVSGTIASMDNLPFNEKEFDLIWAEGSISNIGIEKGLIEWKRFLKDNGMVIFTDATWVTQTRPAEIENFWVSAHPQINTISNNIGIIEKCGYLPVAHFILPEYCWTDNYYTPMINIIDDFLKENNNNEAAKEFARHMKDEFDIYNKYKSYYSYVFYIGKKLN